MSHSSSFIQVSAMEVLLYFFLTSDDSNVVTQLTALTFHVAWDFFSEQIALFS